MGNDIVNKAIDKDRIKRAQRFMADVPVADVCVGCKNDKTFNTCKAFPKGKPDIVLNGEHRHRTHIEGDNGIKFEKEI